ncbi:MAG: hypothetical protein ACOCYZ_05500, partial [Halococcoides sp.]
MTVAAITGGVAVASVTGADAAVQPDLAVETADGSVAPGETVTVTVTAEDVGLLSLEGIPADWTI